MDYYSGDGPSNFDYNNDDFNDNGNNGGGIVDFFKKYSLFVLIGLAVIIALLIFIFFNTSKSSGGKYNTESNDSTLSSLYVTNGTLEPSFSSDVIKYTVYADSEYVTFECEASDSKAKIENCDDSVSIEEEDFNIKVTAENGDITRYYIKFEKSEYFVE